MKLQIIVGSIRKGRRTEKLAKWVANTTKELEGVELEILDLNDLRLPLFEEPLSPRYNNDRKPEGSVKQWLDALRSGDAYVFVTPEYNHSIPGGLKNAIDYIAWELKRKPALIVSHGVVGGARAAMHLKEILSEAQAVVIPELVVFMQSLDDVMDEEGNLSEELRTQPYGPEAALKAALAELKWFGDTLKAAREQAQV